MRQALAEIDSRRLGYVTVYQGGRHRIVCNRVVHYRVHIDGDWFYDGKCRDWYECPNRVKE